MATTAPNDDLIERISLAIRPLIEAEGYDLVLVEHLANAQILRIYIDSDAGIGVDDCAQVSRRVSDILDGEGLTEQIPGAFSLEVSSPGLDRPLTRPRDFCRFVGQQAKITTRTPNVAGHPGRRRFKGLLLAADESDDGAVRIDLDGSEVAIGYGLIEQARLIPEL